MMCCLIKHIDNFIFPYLSVCVYIYVVRTPIQFPCKTVIIMVNKHQLCISINNLALITPNITTAYTG